MKSQSSAGTLVLSLESASCMPDHRQLTSSCLCCAVYKMYFFFSIFPILVSTFYTSLEILPTDFPTKLQQTVSAPLCSMVHSR